MDIKHVSGTDQRAARQQKKHQEHDENSQQSQPDSHSNLSQPDQVDVDLAATRIYELIESHLPEQTSITPWFLKNAYPRNNIILLQLSRHIQQLLLEESIETDFNELMDTVRKHVTGRVQHLEPPYELFHQKTGMSLEPLVSRGRLFPANLLEDAEKQLLAHWFLHTDGKDDLYAELSLLVLAFSFDRWQKQIKGYASPSLHLDCFTHLTEAPMDIIISTKLLSTLKNRQNAPG